MLEIKEILKNYPQVLVFNKDNYQSAPVGLLDFYQKTSMTGDSFDLTYLRSPTFFDFIFCHSDDFLVFVGTNKKNEITGIASMIFRQGYIKGAKQRVCYLADLRLSYDRETLRQWRPLMSELLAKSLDIKEISTDAFYTAVIDGNKKAQRALVNSNNDFIYDELTSYKMINILSPLPWKINSNKEFKVRRANSSDLEILNQFLDDKDVSFGEVFNQSNLQNRFKSWKNLKPESFYLCFSEDKLVATFAPWSPLSKKNKVLRIPFYFKILRLFFNLPKAGESLEILYLTHLKFSSSLNQKQTHNAFLSMLNFFYNNHESLQDYHLVSFCDYPALDLVSSLKSQYISSSIPMKLFTVRHKNKPKFEANKQQTFGFEMALV